MTREDRLEAALRQWVCVFCDKGFGKEREWPDFQKPCSSCGGSGLNPIARDALDESGNEQWLRGIERLARRMLAAEVGEGERPNDR